MKYRVEVRFRKGGEFWPLEGQFDFMRALNLALRYEGRGYDARVVGVKAWRGELGEFTLGELLEFYGKSVDKGEYPEFAGWVWDMERSALLFRHEC